MTGVPSNIEIPFFGMDFDGTLADVQGSDMPVKLLLMGQRLSAGEVPELTKYNATIPDEVGAASGFGSMLHIMAMAACDNNDTVEMTVIGIDDALGSAAGTFTQTITGTATKAGELPFYAGGRRYAVSVAVGDEGADIYAALIEKLTADTAYLPFTATVAINTLTGTFKNKGVAASDYDFRVCANSGEKVPAGLTVSETTLNAGTVDPDVSEILATIGTSWYNVVANPYADSTNMDEIEEFEADEFGVMKMRGAVVYQAKRDSHSNMLTFAGDTALRNSAHMALAPAYKRMESTYVLAAGIAAAAAKSVQVDPALPLHRMALSGFRALNEDDRWEPTERNQLSLYGCMTLSDDLGVQTESMRTMYLKNSAGADDKAYRLQNTMFQLMAARYLFADQIRTNYPRAKMSTETDANAAGQQIMTIARAEEEAIIWFKDCQTRGLFELGTGPLDRFKAALKVQRVGTIRMEWLLPPDLMNQFIVGSATMQFRL